MIVKNEEKNLARCLESVRTSVDEIVIVDTGSTDGTLEIARRYGTKLFFFSWTGDFSEARNYALSLTQGPWVLWLDADEELVLPAKKIELKTECFRTDGDAFLVPIRNFHQDGSFDVHHAVRLFRKLDGIRFEGKAHEGVDPWLLRMGRKIVSASFVINHYGYAISEEGMRAKLVRNLEILQEQLALNPQDAVSHYLVGYTLYGLGRRKEALRSLKMAYALKPPTKILECMILNLLSLNAYSDQDYPLTERYARESLAQIPQQNTARLYLGLSLFFQRRYKEAFPFLWQAYQFGRLPVVQRRTALTQEHFYKENALLGILAVAAREAGEEALAVQFFRRYRKSIDERAELLAHEGLSLLHCGAYEQAVECLLKAFKRGLPMEDLAPPLAYAFFRSGCPTKALALYRKYPGKFLKDAAGRATATLIQAWQAQRFSKTKGNNNDGLSCSTFRLHDCAQ